MHLSELATAIGATLVPGSEIDVAEIEITGVAPIESAAKGQVTFLTNPAYAKYLNQCAASAVIVKKAEENATVSQLVHNNPYYAFAKTAQLFFTYNHPETGIHPSAQIDPSATIGKDVTVMANTYIGANVTIGDRVVIYPGVCVYKGSHIEEDSVLHANVVLHHDVKVGKRVQIFAGSVLGADGFGFASSAEGHAKIPQTGGVIIGDDVEMGALCTVDRGAMDDTVIGSGTKMDSHVHVAHNVKIGSHAIICGMSAIGGSAKMDDFTVIGGHSAVHNHVHLSQGVQVGGHSAIIKSEKEAGVYMGFPAIPANDWRKAMVMLKKLPEMEKRLRKIEKNQGQ